jgi:hypothetical protein
MEISDSENYTYILISSIEYYFYTTRVRARYGPPRKIVTNAAYNDSCIFNLSTGALILDLFARVLG